MRRRRHPFDPPTIRRMRPEDVEDVEHDTVARFVADLRQLWDDEGRIPFERLATKVRPQKSALAAAVKGSKLPSDYVVGELVGYLRPDDKAWWLRRRQRLQERLERATVGAAEPARSSAEEHALDDAGPRDAEPRSLPTWSGLVAASALAAAIAGVGGFVLGHVTNTESSPRISSVREAADGDDPQSSGCVPDASPIASASVPEVGTLKLMYSTTCDAFWAKIERTDGRALGNRVELAVVQLDDRERIQDAVEPDTTSAYTYVLSRTEAGTRICATGTIWTDEVPTTIPGPVC